MWIPDLTVINANEVRDYREDYQKIVQIYSNGTVQYYMILLTSFVCNYDVSKCNIFHNKRILAATSSSFRQANMQHFSRRLQYAHSDKAYSIRKTPYSRTGKKFYFNLERCYKISRSSFVK